MKTIEQIKKEYKSQTLDGRDILRLAQYLPFEDLESIGLKVKEGVTKEQWVTKTLTYENVVADMRKDVAFGFTKALNRRGISAGLMYEVVKMWLYILEDDLYKMEDYAQYGLPLFKAVAVKFGFDNPIGDKKGNEFIFSSDSEEWFEQ